MDRAFDRFSTPVGECLVVVEDGALVELSFRPKRDPDARRDPGTVRRFRKAVEGYFESGEFPRVPLDLSWATPFRRAVYDVVMSIPRGRLLTYGEVAARAGRGSARAVGQAMGANRICLAVP
ncbi:MAG: methylated-DNA--[protein]-cysteine S-methyltransferase [Planctomycetes bacterium]|nr:methylated-DNA--[protein]-cysteine S-methyltransferase [Planctomycetota bacterium]